MRSSILISSRAIPFALVLGAGLALGATGCEGSITPGSPTSSTSGLTVSADCQKAQSDCQAAVSSLAQMAKAQAKTCADSIQMACSADPTGDACKMAQAACTASLTTIQGGVAQLSGSCGAQISSACGSTAAGADGGATTISTTVTSVDAGAAAGPSQACLDSVTACQKQADTFAKAQLANGASCKSAVEAACMTVTPSATGPSDACTMAIQGCTSGASGAGQQAAGIGQACVDGVTKACGVPSP
jgi:hypothetical protein